MELQPRPGQPPKKPQDDDARIRQELAALAVRGQGAQVLEALRRPEVAKFLSEPLDATGASALHLAVLGGHLDFVQELINSGCSLSIQDGHGQEALHLAAAEGHSDLVLELLLAKANANAVDAEGRTALHLASWCGSVLSASVLLEHSAAQLQDHNGRTPLFIAAEQGKTELLGFFLEKDPATATIPNNALWTPLHVAAWGMQSVKNFTKPLKFVDCVELLLGAQSPLEAKDENCCTALHRAAQANNCETSRTLLEAKADVSAEDECRWTPLHYASQDGFVKMMELLLDAKADAVCHGAACSTPLALATMENQVHAVELLLQHRADPSDRVKGLDSPLMMVRRDPAKYADVKALFEIGFVNH